MDVRGGDERVDPGPAGVPDRAPGGIDVGYVGASQPGDHGALHLARDLLHGLEITRRGDGEAGLDHVDAKPSQLLRDLQLLLGVEGDAGRLLAVAQRGVEDQYSVWVLGASHVASS